MTTTDVDRIRISAPDDLIEAIPYLLGFHPTDSVVLVGFAGPGPMLGTARNVAVALRIDLPTQPVEPGDLHQLTDALARSEVTAVVCVLFVPGHGLDAATREGYEQLVAPIGRQLSSVGVELMDVLLAGEDRWWSLLCSDSRCCPPEGAARALGCSLAAAQATVAGLVALDSRAELAAHLDGLPADQRHRLDPQLAQAENRVTGALLANGLRRLRRADTAALLKAAARFADSHPCRGDIEPGTARPSMPRLSARQTARFGVALTDLTIRDDVWLAIDEQSVDASSLLRDLIRRLPEPYDAAPLFLYGWQQWRDGNGALACMAAQRALASDRGCSAAALLISAVENGLNPRTTPTLREIPDPAAGTSGGD
ncbi:MAG TPA: DUF4192 domain-containing protein [Jatrophihabitans sp.]|jgi:hypothetical protein